jgi:hypothetical protein
MDGLNTGILLGASTSEVFAICTRLRTEPSIRLNSPAKTKKSIKIQIRTLPTPEYIIELSVKDSAGPINQYTCPNTNNSNSSTTTSVTLSVDASAIPNAQQVEVLSSLGGGFSYANTGSIPLSLASGTSDFLVSALDAHQNVLAIRRLHSQTIPGSLNGGQPVVLTTSDETTVEPVTFQNAPANSSPSPYPFFFTASGLGFSVMDQGTNYHPLNAYQGMPADVMESGDYYQIIGAASLPINGSFTEGSSVLSTITTPTTGPVSITLPQPLPAADANNLSFTANTLPTFNLAYGGFSDPSLTYLAYTGQIAWTQESSSNVPQADFLINVYATASYMNGATTLPIPDLSSIPGFVAAPGSGAQLNWIESVTGQSYPLFANWPTTSTTDTAEILGLVTVQ